MEGSATGGVVLVNLRRLVSRLFVAALIDQYESGIALIGFPVFDRLDNFLTLAIEPPISEGSLDITLRQHRSATINDDQSQIPRFQTV